jgi:mannosyl-3-phosphoglycerate phosphatase family protein
VSDIRLLIFSDLDGTLLDHHTYSHAPADELLAKLASVDIPVIPCTSKTRSEVESLRVELNLHDPFIIENGAAVYVPEDCFSGKDNGLVCRDRYLVKEFVEKRAHWQKLLQQLDTNLQREFISFQQAGVEGIIEMTGLSYADACLSAQREYGEPLQWRGDVKTYAAFEKAMHASGATLLKGGRFVHVSGASNKGRALHWLTNMYAKQAAQQKVVTLALGDSHNDVAMFEVVDHAAVIKSPVQSAPEFNVREDQDVYITKECGPHGWVEAVTRVLKKYNIKTN